MNDFRWYESTLYELEHVLNQFVDKYPFMTVIYKWSWNMDSYIVSFNFDEVGKADIMYDDLERIHNYFKENSQVIFTINEELFKVPGPYRFINKYTVRNEKLQNNSYRRW